MLTQSTRCHTTRWVLVNCSIGGSVNLNEPADSAMAAKASGNNIRPHKDSHFPHCCCWCKWCAYGINKCCHWHCLGRPRRRRNKHQYTGWSCSALFSSLSFSLCLCKHQCAQCSDQMQKKRGITAAAAVEEKAVKMKKWRMADQLNIYQCWAFMWVQVMLVVI